MDFVLNEKFIMLHNKRTDNREIKSHSNTEGNASAKLVPSKYLQHPHEMPRCETICLAPPHPTPPPVIPKAVFVVSASWKSVCLSVFP